jgi:hypothetical protein
VTWNHHPKETEMRRSTLTKRLVLAAGIPAAAAAGVLLAAGTSAASSHTAPTHAVSAQTTRQALVTHERRDAVEPKRHHHAEPGDARGRANEPGEDVRGHDGEAEQGNDRGHDQGDDSSGHGSDHSGSGHDGSGDD